MASTEETNNKQPVEDEGVPTASLGAGAVRLGGQIGPYKLLNMLGEGGFAVVYLAEQQRPVKRRVALKIIKPGMDTKQVIARFEAERQALALLSHPNVAHVYDAGTTDPGRPYFVMEYVKGVPITEHCDRHKLTIEERLKLFLQVCEAVQHAHQKGIIHRDIKPSNILILFEGQRALPKVIDFGIAKAVSQPLTERTLYTEQGQLVGTPEYMSPEQAEMSSQDIDTRSDIYSLGVVLYELLTGVLPFEAEELRKGGLDHIRTVIREQEPRTPSTRLSRLTHEETTKLAQHRCAEPRALQRRLRGDLDWITLKAMEKDRTRRYGSAGELAADIRHHLNNEPVVAGPPSTVYRLKKFVRRNRALVTGIAAVLAVLAGGVVVSTLLAIGQARARAEAERQAKISQAVSDFLRKDLLASVDPTKAKGRELTVRSFLDTASENLKGKFKNEPLVEASIRDTLGWTYRMLGESNAAEPHLERALQIRQEQLGAENLETLHSVGRLAWLRCDQGRTTEAAELLEKGLSTSRRLLGDEHAMTLGFANTLGCVYKDLGRCDEAEQLYLKGIPAAQRVLGHKNDLSLFMVGNLGQVYEDQRRYDEAERQYLETLQLRDGFWDDENIWTLVYKSFLAGVYMRQKRYDEAERLYLEILPIQRRVDGDQQLRTLRSVTGLAQLYTYLGKYDEAENLFAEALAALQSVRGSEHWYTLRRCMNGLAALYAKQELYSKAEPLLKKALEISRRNLRDNHPDTLESWNNLIDLYEAWGKPQEAEKWRTKLADSAEAAAKAGPAKEDAEQR